MLFSSISYLYVFFPIVLILYFAGHSLLNQTSQWSSIIDSKWVLILASLYFYASFKFNYLFIILASIAFNFAFSALVKKKRLYLILGIIINALPLFYFKYSDFFFETLNDIFGKRFFSEVKLELPLAISFFTFQQIAYLVDCYKGLERQRNVKDYLLFVTFFPHLIAGPIIH